MCLLCKRVKGRVHQINVYVKCCINMRVQLSPMITLEYHILFKNLHAHVFTVMRKKYVYNTNKIMLCMLCYVYMAL